ncbi:MAG: 3-phosphoserine/phosphohydroxythreonine transaminase [Ichthyobacteriaceae bacterium]|nr:3-phosphoserine/phosphohydroxythreonine transaminase [Ichthyobacteriaceae bacterium]
MAKHNYAAGPCVLPQDVFKKAAEAVLDLDGIGLSVLEISHRSKEFIAVMEKAQSLVKEILSVPEGYSVLFLQGGASLQFLMVPFNLLNTNGKAAYIETGAWAKKAYKEAAALGNAEVLASSADKNYNYIPKGFEVPKGLDYLHITTNNTIYGTQFKEYPTTDGLLIADMSSDIFSQKIDISKFDLIYAGAQKNLGPAGTTLVIVKDEILAKTDRKIPSMLDYQIHAKADSMFNTPPVFSIYVAMLNLEHMKAQGGIEAIQKHNEEKAAMLYNEIDKNPLFVGTAELEDRSNMNVCFLLTDESKKEAFDKAWAAAEISGIKGHRSVGGYRASIYNALTKESVQALVDTMAKLA